MNRAVDEALARRAPPQQATAAHAPKYRERRHIEMNDPIAAIREFGEDAAAIIPHRFEIVTRLNDGTPIPPEALSEDHTVGLYADVVPRKMRENAAGFRDVDLSDLLPQMSLETTTTGARIEWFLESPGLRAVRFRTERLQYLEEGWWAVTSEVKYPAATVLGLLYVMKRRYGAAHICLNTELPMPLWLRSAPLAQAAVSVQAVVQARGEGRLLLTNIHTECPMEFARQFVPAIRGYYRRDESEGP
jgi:hypothetical protein